MRPLVALVPAVSVFVVASLIAAPSSAQPRSSEAVAPSVFVDPRPGRQVVRLGSAVISRDGSAQFLDLARLVAHIPGSRCDSADRPIHTPRGRDVTRHVMLGRRGLKVYVGSLGDATCSPDLRAAPELIVVTSSSVTVRTPFGVLRVGKSVPSALYNQDLSRPTVGFREEVWFTSDACKPTTITPDALIRVTYVRPITGQGPAVPITKIQIRTGALETGECAP